MKYVMERDGLFTRRVGGLFAEIYKKMYKMFCYEYTLGIIHAENTIFCIF